MVSTLDLLKIFFKEKFFNRKTKVNKKTNTPIIGAVLLMFLFILYAVMITSSFTMMFEEQKLIYGNCNRVLYTIVGVTNISSLFFVILSGNNLTFSKTDESVLGCLPINERKIVLSKLIESLIMDTLFNIVVGICGTIAYIICGDISLVGLFVVMIAPLVSGILPLAFFSFLIILIKRAINKSKFKRIFEIIGLLFTIIFLFAFSLLLSFSSTSYDSASISIVSGLYEKVLTYYPLLILIKMAIDSNNILFFILYILVILLIAFIFIVLFTKYGYKLMLIENKTYNGIKSKIEYKKNNIEKVLIKKEFKKIFSSNVIMLNTFTLSLLFYLAFGMVAFSLTFKSFNFKDLGIDIDINISILELFGAYFLILIVSGQYFPAFNISLESKNIWILMSMPVKENSILKIKRDVNYIIQGVSALIMLVLYLILAEFNIIYIIGYIVLGVGTSIFSTNIYQIINLKNPSIGQDETALVKRSKASLISSLIITAFMFVFPVIIFILIFLIKNVGITILIAGFIFLLIGLLLNKKVNNIGPTLLKNFC